MKKTFILCLSLISFLFSQSQVRYLKGILQSSQEVPATNSTGSGVVIVKYDMATKTVKLYGDYAGLTAAITASHIHREQPGVSGPVVLPLQNTGDTTGTLSGTGTLTKPQEDSLLAGNMYANVHTSNNPNGELRAQLTLTTDGGTTLLSGRLQSAQETPPNTSTGSGSVYALLDFMKDSMFVTGNYKDLTGPSNNAHVHLANPGTAGGVLFPIHHSSKAAGVVHAATDVPANAAATISIGGSYVNVHTGKFPNGELRAQLINNSTSTYYTGELSGANESTPNTSKARGTVIANYNPDTKVLILAGDYQNLTDTIKKATLVTPSVNPDSVINLTTSRDSTGTLTSVGTILTDAQAADLMAGKAYVNVFDSAFTGGEIRANLAGTTPGETQAFLITLDPIQEVPTNTTSAALGNAFVILDKATGMAYATGAYQGINSRVTSAYIRGGAVADTSGSIFLPLTTAYVSHLRVGTFSGTGTIAPAAIDSMINGLAYINVFSTRLTTGAVRGQLGNLVLPVKLVYFNGYKKGNEVQVVWETAEELNVSRYEVEQLNSVTKNWDAKGTVYAKGGNSGSSYSFNDVPNVNSGKYLIYRLKMVDKDGKFTYSSLVKINFAILKAELFIQTNPVVNGELKYTITGLPSGKKAEVSIIDYSGRVVLRNTISSLMNNTLRIHRLSSGMYKLMVRIDDTLLQQGFVK